MSTKATFTPAKTETKTIEVEPAKVTLELTPEQALTVYKLVNGSYRAINSFPGYTANDERHSSGVFRALRDLGLHYEQVEPQFA